MNGNPSSVSTRNCSFARSVSSQPCAIDDQTDMVKKFEKVMAKLAVLGHIPALLTDCSEVIPVPKPAAKKIAHIPAGKTLKDIEASVSIILASSSGSCQIC